MRGNRSSQEQKKSQERCWLGGSVKEGGLPGKSLKGGGPSSLNSEEKKCISWNTGALVFAHLLIRDCASMTREVKL